MASISCEKMTLYARNLSDNLLIFRQMLDLHLLIAQKLICYQVDPQLFAYLAKWVGFQFIS